MRAHWGVVPPVVIVAELGSNHDGSLGAAMALASAAIDAGCDVVKLQDHRGQVIAPDAAHPPWMHPAAAAAESRHDYIVRTCFSASEWTTLSSHVRSRGAKFAVSPFSVGALACQLRGGRLDVVKIASGQISNAPLLRMASESGLPVHVSCGMTSPKETLAALGEAAWSMGKLTVLHCTSEYPCAPEHVNLGSLPPVWIPKCAVWGFSDHTLGNAASLAAIALGAAVVERHVGWDRRCCSSDAQHSLTIDEFAAFVREVRGLERMLAPAEPVPTLAATRAVFLA